MATSSTNQNNAGKNSNQSSNQGSGKQGFASMDPERQREIASQGGQAAHAAGTAHEFTSEEAREAGSHSHEGSSRSSTSTSGGSGSSSGSGSQSGSSSSSRGGSSEQHAEAGRQSHKNDTSSGSQRS